MIFEDIDPIWLSLMWETEGSACADMIEILISLAFLKLWSRLWFADLLKTILTFCYSELYLFPDDDLMTSTFDDYLWYYGDVVFISGICCVMFIYYLKSHSLSKVFRCNFLVTTRKVISQKSCPRGTWLGWRAMGSITSNWFTRRARPSHLWI